MHYEKLTKMIDELPLTMAVGIFIHAAEHAWKKGCFNHGGMARICKRIEGCFPRPIKKPDQTPMKLTCGKCHATVTGTVLDIHKEHSCGGMLHTI